MLSIRSLCGSYEDYNGLLQQYRTDAEYVQKNVIQMFTKSLLGEWQVMGPLEGFHGVFLWERHKNFFEIFMGLE